MRPRKTLTRCAHRLVLVQAGVCLLLLAYLTVFTNVSLFSVVEYSGADSGVAASSSYYADASRKRSNYLTTNSIGSATNGSSSFENHTIPIPQHQDDSSAIIDNRLRLKKPLGESNYPAEVLINRSGSLEYGQFLSKRGQTDSRRSLERSHNNAVERSAEGGKKTENPALENSALKNTALEHLVMEKPVLENPAPENPVLENPALGNREVENPELEKPELKNHALEKPALKNLALKNSSLEKPQLGNPTLNYANRRNNYHNATVDSLPTNSGSSNSEWVSLPNSFITSNWSENPSRGKDSPLENQRYFFRSFEESHKSQDLNKAKTVETNKPFAHKKHSDEIKNRSHRTDQDQMKRITGPQTPNRNGTEDQRLIFNARNTRNKYNAFNRTRKINGSSVNNWLHPFGAAFDVDANARGGARSAVANRSSHAKPNPTGPIPLKVVPSSVRTKGNENKTVFEPCVPNPLCAKINSSRTGRKPRNNGNFTGIFTGNSTGNSSTTSRDGVKLLTLFTTWAPTSRSKRQVHGNTLRVWARFRPDVALILYRDPPPVGNRTDATTTPANMTRDINGTGAEEEDDDVEAEMIELAKDLGWTVREVPRVSPHGAPILRHMFLDAQDASESFFYAYANGDILFAMNFLDTLEFLRATILGRPINVSANETGHAGAERRTDGGPAANRGSAAAAESANLGSSVGVKSARDGRVGILRSKVNAMGNDDAVSQARTSKTEGEGSANVTKASVDFNGGSTAKDLKTSTNVEIIADKNNASDATGGINQTLVPKRPSPGAKMSLRLFRKNRNVHPHSLPAPTPNYADVFADGLLVVGMRYNFNVSYGTGRKRAVLSAERVARDYPARLVPFGPYAVDYFATTRDGYPWRDAPDFVVGRPAYDNWLIANAIVRGVAVVDATATALALHQTDEEGNAAGRARGGSAAEKEWNARLAGEGFAFELGRTECAGYATAMPSRVTRAERRPREISLRVRPMSFSCWRHYKRFAGRLCCRRGTKVFPYNETIWKRFDATKANGSPYNETISRRFVAARTNASPYNETIWKRFNATKANAAPYNETIWKRFNASKTNVQ
jgi:hypothetical protein